MGGETDGRAEATQRGVQGEGGVGGDQGGARHQRVGRRIPGASDADYRMEEAGAGRDDGVVCRRTPEGPGGRRGAQGAVVPGDRPVESGAGLLEKKVRAAGLMEKRAVIEAEHPVLSVRRQCRLMGLARSGLYYEPQGESAENLALTRLIDEAYTAWPFYGVRKMTAHLD